MNKDHFETLCKIWQPERPPRVWSVLVTLFGDLAQSPDAHVSGSAISAVLNGINIKPEAIRVALHRLRNDGWIESVKVGRKSNYSLTAWGLAECGAANSQIYGPWLEQTHAYLIFPEPGSQCNATRQAQFALAPNIFVSTKPVDTETTLVVPLSSAQDVPHWVAQSLCAMDIQGAAAVFQTRMESFEASNVSGVDMTDLQTAILRTIIVHEWRRIILRVPALPDFLLPAGCLRRECRKLVDETLSRLGKPKLENLNKV